MDIKWNRTVEIIIIDNYDKELDHISNSHN